MKRLAGLSLATYEVANMWKPKMSVRVDCGLGKRLAVYNGSLPVIIMQSHLWEIDKSLVALTCIYFLMLDLSTGFCFL